MNEFNDSLANKEPNGAHLVCGLQGEVRSDTSLNIPLSHGPQIVSFVAVAGSGTVRLVTLVTLQFVGCTFANLSEPTYNHFRHMSFTGLPALGLPSRTLGSEDTVMEPIHSTTPAPMDPLSLSPVGSTFSARALTQTSHRHHTQRSHAHLEPGPLVPGGRRWPVYSAHSRGHGSRSPSGSHTAGSHGPGTLWPPSGCLQQHRWKQDTLWLKRRQKNNKNLWTNFGTNFGT